MAQTVFEDSLHLSVLDARERGEERWITIGRNAHLKTLVVAHTYCSSDAGREIIRIISARKATRKEMKKYEEGI